VARLRLALPLEPGATDDRLNRLQPKNVDFSGGWMAIPIGRSRSQTTRSFNPVGTRFSDTGGNAALERRQMSARYRLNARIARAS
jgi:hypothetical protein